MLNKFLLAALLLYCSTANAQSLYDMGGLPSNEREIYDTPIDLSGVDGTLWNDATQQSNALDAVEDLSPNSALDQFDFSGISVATWKHGRNQNGSPVPDQITRSLPVTMVSATHGIASGHNGPNVGERVYFRAPDGTAVMGVVSHRFDWYGDTRLIRFTANPSSDLKRYPILDNANDCIGRNTWWPDQDLTLRLRRVFFARAANQEYAEELRWSDIQYSNSFPVWTNNVVSTGSGRPALIALTDGELVVAGTLWSSYSTTWTYHDRTRLEPSMNGETLTFMSVPTTATTVTGGARSLVKPQQFNPFQFGRSH
jgi:hypothetical protein